MSITIATKNKRFTIKMEEPESEELFTRLVQDVLGITTFLEGESVQVDIGAEDSDVQELVSHLDKDEYPVPAVESNHEVDNKKHAAGEPEGYGGFLYVQCEKCGHTHAFSSKNRLTYYKCTECGMKTILVDLVPLYLNCECGRRSNYMTNMDEYAFDVDCVVCGNPVAVKYNSRKKTV